MYKPSIAVVISSMSALSYQASAEQEINIEKAKVSEDLVNAMREQLSHTEPVKIIEGNFDIFCNTLKTDDKEMSIDVEAFLASKKTSANSTKRSSSSTATRSARSASSAKNQDSTNVKLNTNIVRENCHNACHSNCHGSRSWR